MKLLVVILNYRTTELTIDCLRSLAPQIADRGDATVAVVENGSGDGAEAELRAAIAANAWDGWAKLIPLGQNLGFTAGNNLAIRRARDSSDAPQYVLLLNSDTVALPGAVENLLRFMDEHPRAGIAGSRLEYPSGALQGSPFRFHGIASELDRGLGIGPISRMLAGWAAAPPKPATAEPVDWVAGASMMLRSETMAAVGLLDEGFFAYFEDMDYCLAARRMGWQTWYVPESRIVHKEGASSGIRSDRPESPPEYWFDARRRYFLKNHGLAYTVLVDTALILGCIGGLFYGMIRRRTAARPLLLLGDAVRHSVFAAGFRTP